jgi:hypothetical protein
MPPSSLVLVNPLVRETTPVLVLARALARARQHASGWVEEDLCEAEPVRPMYLHHEVHLRGRRFQCYLVHRLEEHIRDRHRRFQHRLVRHRFLRLRQRPTNRVKRLAKQLRVTERRMQMAIRDRLHLVLCRLADRLLALLLALLFHDWVPLAVAVVGVHAPMAVVRVHALVAVVVVHALVVVVVVRALVAVAELVEHDEFRCAIRGRSRTAGRWEATRGMGLERCLAFHCRFEPSTNHRLLVRQR